MTQPDSFNNYLQFICIYSAADQIQSKLAGRISISSGDSSLRLIFIRSTNIPAVGELLQEQKQAEGIDAKLISSPWRRELLLLLIAAAVFLGCMVSPPSLMDDVDAAHAQL